MTIYEKLSAIQAELKVPKDQENKFGGYTYRSCEDILEKVKPICNKHKVVLVLSDELVNIGDRYYVKATATITNIDEELCDHITVWAFAREEETKKGMDGSQITGASSSYARKYALNGIFCIDDVKDSDFTNKGDQKPPEQKQPVKKPEPKQADQKFICQDCGAEIDQMVYGYSMLHYGNQAFCRNCQKKHAVVRR